MEITLQLDRVLRTTYRGQLFASESSRTASSSEKGHQLEVLNERLESLPIGQDC